MKRKDERASISGVTLTLAAVGGVVLIGIVGVSASGFLGSHITYEQEGGPESEVVEEVFEEPIETPPIEESEPEPEIDRGDFAAFYVPTPVPLKGIYMTQCVVGTPSFRADLVRFIEETELNAVVIDVKDYTGGIAFPTDNPAVAPYRSDKCGARDMRAFVASLKEKGIYTIARITVFQDPLYATKHPEFAVKRASDPLEVWRDNKGLNFIDVSAQPFWEYILEVARESHKLGFDELNFDYVRFPSDGPMHDVYYPFSKDMSRAEALERFFVYLHAELTDSAQYPRGVEPPVLSADLFGFTTSNTDDLGIGQVLERALPYFDYLMPMVYPSHYPRGSFGFDNPNNYPYEIILRSMGDGVRRTIAQTSPVPTLTSERIYETRVIPAVGTTTATTTERVFTGRYTKEVYDANVMRPWLQDFNYGGTYDAAAIRAQIRGNEDAGLHSWIFWDPGNRYTSLRQVVERVSGE